MVKVVDVAGSFTGMIVEVSGEGAVRQVRQDLAVSLMQGWSESLLSHPTYVGNCRGL